MLSRYISARLHFFATGFAIERSLPTFFVYPRPSVLAPTLRTECREYFQSTSLCLRYSSILPRSNTWSRRRIPLKHREEVTCRWFGPFRTVSRRMTDGSTERQTSDLISIFGKEWCNVAKLRRLRGGMNSSLTGRSRGCNAL